MEVILLEKIPNLGDLGDLVTVKPGYGRNYLVPQKKAVFASEDAKEKVEEARRKLAAEEAKRVEVAKAKADLAPREVSITRLANTEGHLFGSVTGADIAEAMTEAESGAAIEKSEVYLTDGAIKNVGVFSAEIILHPDVRFDISVNVIGEEGEAPDDLEIATSEFEEAQPQADETPAEESAEDANAAENEAEEKA